MTDSKKGKQKQKDLHDAYRFQPFWWATSSVIPGASTVVTRLICHANPRQVVTSDCDDDNPEIGSRGSIQNDKSEWVKHRGDSLRNKDEKRRHPSKWLTLLAQDRKPTCMSNSHASPFIKVRYSRVSRRELAFMWQQCPASLLSVNKSLGLTQCTCRWIMKEQEDMKQEMRSVSIYNNFADNWSLYAS